MENRKTDNSQQLAGELMQQPFTMMSNLSLFEGNYKRKPDQKVGGRFRPIETREMTLIRANTERQMREQERTRASAILILQAGVRRMRVQVALRNRLREEFRRDAKLGEYTLDTLKRQMTRFNYFFKPQQEDIEMLGQLGKAMLSFQEELISNMLEDSCSLHRLRLVIQEGLCTFSERMSSAKRTIVLRLLETFTDWKKVDQVRKSRHPNLTSSSRTNEVMAAIWSHLVLHNDFFKHYRGFLEQKLDVSDADSAKKALEHYDFTIFYQLFLEVIQQLTLTSCQFTISKEIYVTKELVQNLLVELAKSLSVADKMVGNAVYEFVICPCVAKELAIEQDEGRTLWEEEWLQVIQEMVRLSTVPNDSVATSVNIRPVMYLFLMMNRCNDEYQTQTSAAQLFKTLNFLLPAIDNRNSVFSESYLQDDEYEDDLLEDYDMKPLEEFELEKEFFAHRQMIYDELKILFKKTKLNTELAVFTVDMWNLLYPVISCLVGISLYGAILDFDFMKRMTYEQEFLRCALHHVLRKSNRSVDELVVVGWLMTNLMKTLYDGEFFNRSPLNKEELLNFIKILVDTYVDIILSDRDILHPSVNNAKNVIAQTLLNIHDRNLRLHLYPEDVFISTKFSTVFSMETHGIQFSHFVKNQPGGIVPNLSFLDKRLLRVLSDFPFALSFHDRVSIWHQMINEDQMDRQIGSPFGRQHVEIRRAFLYEDAYEKLSSENVPDLRSDVRILLVNVVGAQEAGVDGGGLLREFLTEVTKAGVDPNRGIFRVDSRNRLYPNPVAKRIFADYKKHFFFMGRLVGKALYTQILLELPLAAFFLQLCAFGSVSSAVDYLETLDPEVHENLLKLRSFSGTSLKDLALDFTVDSTELGETQLVELKPGGGELLVDETNLTEYIHLVADYKINREIKDECHYFRCGLLDVIPILRIFSWREMQTLISGSDKPIDVQDWKANTNYGAGYAATHQTIELFWNVVEDFDEAHLRKLLKFVTSCSRPPLLGFKDLVPKFGITNAGVTDHLPTAATCMNLLKLPELTDIDTLRERLVYAISAQAGFELS